MSHRLVSSAALVVGLLMLGAGFGSPASGAEGDVTTFGIQPTTEGKPDARPGLIYGMTQGAVIKDQVAALNFSNEPLPLTVYAADSLPTTDGGFTLEEEAQTPDGVGSWITLDSDREITVPPRTAAGPGSVIIPMSVRVPADAEPGDHAGGVVVSLKSEASQGSGPNVVLDQRVATRVYIRVSGDAVPELTIENLSATADAAMYPFRAAGSTVTYTIRNTGNVAVDYDASASISGVVKAWGEQAPTVDNPDGFPALLPGSSVTVTVEVGNIIPQILMKATAQVQARPAGATDASVAPFVETTRFFAVPWLMVALIALFVLSVLGRILRRRRREAATDDAPAADEMVGVSGQ